MKILLATSNPNKIFEIRTILDMMGIEILTLEDIPGEPPEVVEDGDTFAANAGKKALVVARWAQMPALSDDSGLIVPALGGEPGVHSSRYAGEDGNSEANIALLLERMAEVPEEERLAHFVCVLVLAAPDGRMWQAGGRVDGLIAFEKRGKSGFGYDPVFFYIPAHKTFAEMEGDEKNAVSHRQRALEAFAKMWEEKIKGELGKSFDAVTR
jgi:XTP/dITP diphosphohydrolase